MMTESELLRSLGTEPPILADGRRAPDRREISLRWLSGTFLTGITSSILMGVALMAAMDGRQQLAIPAEAYASTADDTTDPTGADVVKRGNRLIAAAIAAKPTDRAIMDVSTVTHDGEKEVVRKQPFAYVKMSLAANHVVSEDYPAFDALNVFSSDSKETAAAPSAAGQIYGSEVESEVSLKTADFPVDGGGLTFAPSMTLEEVEENVRSNGSVLTDGNAQLASLYYVDPQRFASDDPSLDIPEGLTAKVLEENMTVSAPEAITSQTPEYADDIIPAATATPMVTAMTRAGYSKAQAQDIAAYLSPLMNSEDLPDHSVLRIGIIQEKDQARIVRASVYKDGLHQITVALDDTGKFVQGSEPPELSAVQTAFDDDAPMALATGDLPRVYDGIFRAALSYGMNQDMTARIIRMLASSVDFQAKLKPTDMLEAFFSVSDETGKATDDSELLYVYAKFGDTAIRLYRYQDPEDNSIDYFDQDGKSLKQFLLRNPVPNGIFKSGFGMRRHPILGYMKMHTGVDWAAPRGTPIIAAGSGTVIKAGWDSGGYGNQTLIQHANGYVSSYNHQNAIAKGVKEGAHVNQGQVIGWIGTTGQSTGPHLHYELIVNGNKVDPLRIRLPGGRSLEGEDLARFESERQRIDDLLAKEDKQMASN